MSSRTRGRALPMETGIPEENTLGIVIGRAGRAVTGTARRLTRPGSPHRAGLGTSFLALGAAVVVGLRALYGLTVSVAFWSDYPQPLLAAASWVVLLATLSVGVIASRALTDRMPAWAFALFLTGLAAAVVLDLAAIWELQNVGRYATAAAVAGVGLLAVVTLRGRAEIVIAAAVLGFALAAAMFLTTPLTAATAPEQILTLAAAVLPAVIGVTIVEGFRFMVQVELDRALTQSTVSAPRFAVGMLASEQLARLDLAAEELLETVAQAKTRLPLSPRSASVAASLATELRLHLIEGRRETWLYHAVSESELLGKAVTLVDKSSLAGLLDASQRDGLLSAAWQLVSDTSKKTATASNIGVQIGPVVPGAPVPERKIRIPILITTTGIPRGRVERTVWDSLAKVGRYSDSTQDSSVRVEIDCLVDNPAEH